MTITKNDQAFTDAGEAIIDVLRLKRQPDGRVNTLWGNKTPLGLALTIMRLIDEYLPEETDHV